MSRFTGPRVRVMRALGVDLPGLSPKTADRRPYPPGQHGQRRRKESEFGKRLKEKQKLRFNYGLSEAPLRNVFREAGSPSTHLGESLARPATSSCPASFGTRRLCSTAPIDCHRRSPKR